MSDSLSYPLHIAAASGDIDTLNRLLAEGADVDGRDEVGRTPLFCAAKNGEVAAAKHLLKRGARVDCETAAATTALMAAARGGHADMVRLLLAHGADPNQIVHPQLVVLTPEQEETQRKLYESLSLPGPATDEFKAARRADHEPRQANALVRTLMSRDSDTVMALLEAGADVNYTSGKSDLAPLNIATSFSTPEIIRALVQHGATLGAVDGSGHSVLAKAVLMKPVDVARILLELGARPDSKALQFAITKSDPEKVALLLSFGADPDEAPGGISASFAAYGKPEILALLAAHRGTDWHGLVVAGDLPGVRARLESGGNVDTRDDKGKTALMLVAEAGHVDLVKMLLERGADVNAGDRFQATPLMYGVQVGDPSSYRIESLDYNDPQTDRWK